MQYIDLNGPDGNAFAIMAYAKKFARQLGKPHQPIINEMMAGDYENLLEVFRREFPMVELIRDNYDD